MDSLTLSTGTKSIPVIRDGADVGAISFNPDDVLFAEKFYKLIAEFETRFTEYNARAHALDKDKTKDGYGLPANLDAQIALTKEACEFAYAQIDVLFGAGTSAMVFGDAMVPEVILRFFNVIAPHVQRTRIEKIQQYTNKRPKRK